MSSRPNALGSLLRARRQKRKIGFKQLAAATDLEPETLRKWEVGEIAEPPLRGVLIYARVVGISLEELVEAALPSGEPAGESSPTKREGSGEVASVRDKRRAGDSPPSQRVRRPRSA